MKQIWGLWCVLLSACASGSEPELATGESDLISDQVHNDGTTGFYFLPPMVPQPALEGTLDGSQQPTVQITELATGTLIATFSMTTGEGSELVRSDPSGYIVNWHTDRFPVDPDHVYRIAVSLPSRALGFADVQVVRTNGQAKNIQTNEFVPLVDGRTLPIKFWLNGCASLTCAPPDDCHAQGVCSPETATCSTPALADGTICGGGTGTCQSGACVDNCASITCTASDECHAAGLCDPLSATCSNPAAPDGTSCDGGAGHCEAGACEPNACAYTPRPYSEYQAVNGMGPQKPLVGDVDNDGDLDLVVPDYDYYVSTFLNQGGGVLATSYVFSSTGAFNAGADLADFDLDGTLDLITTSYTQSSIRVSRGTGFGGFNPVQVIDVSPAYARGVSAADLDGNGRPDIATIIGTALQVRFAGAGGVLGVATTYTMPGGDPTAIDTADIDHDGDVDVIVTGRTTNSVVVFENNGTGTLSAGPSSSTGVYPEHLALGDVNGDGHIDVVTGNFVSNSLSVLLGAGDGSLGASQDYLVPIVGSGDYSNVVSLADLDRDGDLDATVGAYNNSTNASTLALMLNDGTGVFGPWTQFGSGTGSGEHAVADVDGNGATDLVTVDRTSRKIRVYLGDCF